MTDDLLRNLTDLRAENDALRAENKALREWGERAVGELAKWVSEAERKAPLSKSDVNRATSGRVRDAIKRTADRERRTAESARAVLDEYPRHAGGEGQND